jgi:FKBP-type peptidyl-prolyl cis-trans isomerase FklB
MGSRGMAAIGERGAEDFMDRERRLGMKIILWAGLSAFLLTGQVLAAEEQKAGKDAQSQKEKVSYSIGYMSGSRMKTDSVELNLDTYMKGFKDGYAGEKGAMTEQEMREAMQPLQKELAAKRAEEMKKSAEMRKQLGEKNKAEGEAFLAENSKKKGVVTLPSGLQCKITKEGKGKSPQKTDKVKVNYRGTLINGTEFDSSYKRGEPATFGVDKVIKGWTEALQFMKEGANWTIYVPSNLAYGERGAGNLIGPNETLIFEVELISVL